jgi:hypothetical protein
MNYRRAIREALMLFPAELVTSNAEKDPEAVVRSRNLAHAWENAENLTKSWSVWHQLAVWSIGCALHRLVKQEGAKGALSVSKHQLDRKYVEFKFAESLLTANNWHPRQVKRAYQRDRQLRGLPRGSTKLTRYEG